MDPTIFTIHIGNLTLSLHWYAVLAMTATLVGAWLSARQVAMRGENPEHVWDGLTWALPAAVVGARLWYVLNDILGGGQRYIQDPVDIVRVWEGGLHYFGALLFGAAAIVLYARSQKLDIWLMLDSITPTTLIGQALARPANYINQELYGPPTDLPWGLRIDAGHRIPPWHDVQEFPVETTRFHPTFAYEMIWNLVAGFGLLWFARLYHRRTERHLRPGTITGGWLLLAGIGRIIIETWRPDQPRIPGTDFSWSRLIAVLMTLAGALLLLAIYRIIRIPILAAGRTTYRLSPRAHGQETSGEQEPAATGGGHGSEEDENDMSADAPSDRNVAER